MSKDAIMVALLAVSTWIAWQQYKSSQSKPCSCKDH